jgi:hypothetical protein
VLREKLGDHVQVVALPPVLLSGVNSPTLVRNLIETEYWAERVEGNEGELVEAHQVHHHGQTGGARAGKGKEEC